MLSSLLLLSALNLSSGAPVGGPIDNDNGVILMLTDGELPACMNSAHYRTLQEIVWSCLATIFASSWFAVHPNLPGPYDSRWLKFKRTATLLVYAMIAPEAMTVWALAQRRAAKQIAKEFNEEFGKPERGVSGETPRYSLNGLNDWLRGPKRSPDGWTLTHGFLVQMGGFLLYEGNDPTRVLTFDDLKEMVRKGEVDAPAIKEHEIEDRSKREFLTKLVVVIQILWFALHCLTRWASHLRVTHLEVVTLAFVTLNLVTYGIWRKKPQNFLGAVAVPSKLSAEEGLGVNNLEPENESEGLFRLGGEKEGRVQRAIKRRMREGVRGWVLGIPAMFVVGLIYPLIKMGGLDGVNKVHRRSLRVPMFYAQHSDSIESLLVLVVGIFGALHFIPWTTPFPSTTELWLWRSSALVITIEPLILTLAALVVWVLQHRAEWLAALLVWPLATIGFLGLPLYVCARLALLSIAFTTLRTLPGGAYTDIEWTTFIPHV